MRTRLSIILLSFLLLTSCVTLGKPRPTDRPMTYEEARAHSKESLDSKITALSAITDIQSTDVFLIVDDPGGSPASKKITALDVFDLINTPAKLETISNSGAYASDILAATSKANFQGTLSIDDIITLTGIAEGTAHLGTFTGTTISDSVTIKAAVQALETALELRATLASPTFTGTVVLPNSQALVTPVLGIPTSGTLTNCTGLPTAGISDANAGTDITADLEEEAHASEHEVGGADLIDNIPLTASPASNYGASGLIDVMTIDASAGSTYGSCLHIDTDGEWVKADANSINTMPCMGLAIEDGVGSKQILRHGRYRYDTWGWTVGGLIYASETEGGLTQTASG